MKILYAIQGTGNGHLSRAFDIIPILQRKVNLDILLSGTQADIKLPFTIKYRMRGMGFIFGKKGGVDIWKTYKELSFKNLLREISSLPIEDYNLVINDFEPISAWAAKLKGIPCISLSHQSAVLNKLVPKPQKKDWLGKQILKFYAPTKHKYGFHFENYTENIFTPIIRNQVRKQLVRDKGHYTVYLPAYADEILIKTLSTFKNVIWDVFSKHSNISYNFKNVYISPINNENFVKSMASSTGVLCGAGFETPAEALFFRKKLMVIPMKNQYEQQCNAAALKNMGVPVIKSLNEKNLSTIADWLKKDKRVLTDYKNRTEQIIENILEFHLHSQTNLTLNSELSVQSCI